MSKPVASESKDSHKSREMNVKREAEDEGDENGEEFTEIPPAESLPISTVVSTVPATTDQFMFTPEFRRHFIEFVPGDTLMTLKLATKRWKAAADAFIDEGVKSRELIVHGGKDVAWFSSTSGNATRRTLVTRVIFLLNITKVGMCACCHANNLIVVDIPEGVESIGGAAFCDCDSLTAVSFPTTLKLIGECAFGRCSSLDNVDLLHTNLQEIGDAVFIDCSELKSMTIPDSLQTRGRYVFHKCSKIVPSNIDVSDDNNYDATSEVIAHLRSKQKS